MDKSSGVPPYGNTGALNTTTNQLRALVDWVQATFKHLSGGGELAEILGLNLNDFVEMNTGGYGWTNCLRRGNIKIYWGGTKQLGVHLEISGQGCREVEVSSTRNWVEIFRDMLRYGASFTRLDLAIDDFGKVHRKDRGLKPYFSVLTLLKKAEEGLCISKFEWGRTIGKIRLADGTYHGRSIYFGSPQSRIQIRVYEKNWERTSKGYELEEGVSVWNRTEVQSRDERAQQLATVIAADQSDLMETVAGVIMNYVRFADRSETDTNRSRWKTCRFWSEFLGHVKGLRLSMAAPDKTLVKSYEWLDKGVARTIGKVMNALDWDVNQLLEIAYRGHDRMTETDFKQVDREKDQLKIQLKLWANDKRNLEIEQRMSDNRLRVLFDDSNVWDDWLPSEQLERSLELMKAYPGDDLLERRAMKRLVDELNKRALTDGAVEGPTCKI